MSYSFLTSVPNLDSLAFYPEFSPHFPVWRFVPENSQLGLGQSDLQDSDHQAFDFQTPNLRFKQEKNRDSISPLDRVISSTSKANRSPIPLSPSHAFPDLLWKVPHPELKEIFIQGRAEALELLFQLPTQGLAIVGTRNPQPRSIQFLQAQIRDLAGTSLIILSGLARGIDAVAHSSALTWGLPTIAFLGTGLDQNYPQSNARLRREILEAGGLVISEFPPGKPGFAHQFLQRNRLIAAWSQATWVVEAGQKSGALNTAKWARELDKTCYSVPGFPGDLALAGNQTLLDRDHALAYWGVQSLGATWLDLAAHLVPRSQRGGTFTSGASLGGSSSPPLTDPEVLRKQILTWTHQKGGTHVGELMDWAASQNWSPDRFFEALRVVLQRGWAQDQFGALVGI